MWVVDWILLHGRRRGWNLRRRNGYMWMGKGFGIYGLLGLMRDEIKDWDG